MEEFGDLRQCKPCPTMLVELLLDSRLAEIDKIAQPFLSDRAMQFISRGVDAAANLAQFLMWDRFERGLLANECRNVNEAFLAALRIVVVEEPAKRNLARGEHHRAEALLVADTALRVGSQLGSATGQDIDRLRQLFLDALG